MRARWHTRTASNERECITDNAFEFLKNNIAEPIVEVLNYLFFLIGAALVGAYYNYSEKRIEIILLLIILILTRCIVVLLQWFEKVRKPV
jgi:hypothetical protein